MAVAFSLLFLCLCLGVAWLLVASRLPSKKKPKHKEEVHGETHEEASHDEHDAHDDHSHHKKGPWASFVGGIKDFLEVILKVALICVAIVFGLWLCVKLGVPGFANWAAKEAGGKGHPQYEARHTPPSAPSGPQEPILLPYWAPDEAVSKVRELPKPDGRIIDFPNDTWKKISEDKTIRCSIAKPWHRDDVTEPNGTPHSHYYCWSTVPGEVMKYSWK